MSTPFMPLYVGDYLRDTRGLTAEQHGAYLLLLMSMWNAGGSLPDDDRKLARFASCAPARWAKIRDDVLEFFDVADGIIRHKRLGVELEKAQEKSVKRAESGSAGGKAKALITKDAHVANATVSPPDLLCHSSEPEPEKKSSSLRSDDSRSQPSDAEPELEIIPPSPLDRQIKPIDFDRVFWGPYPNKVGRIIAEASWAKACKRPGVTVRMIQSGLERYLRSKPPDRSWCNPATWLNQGRWSDESADDRQPSRQDRAYPSDRQDVSGPHHRQAAALARAFGGSG